MTNKGIWAGLVAIAFVAGSIMTGTMAYAASNAQGQPFQQLQQQVNNLQDQIDEFIVDSFFDVMYRITVPSCPEGERPTLNENNDGYTCVPRESNDSFFDITVDTKQQIETEIVALELHSADPIAHHEPDNLGNHMAEQNLDMKRFDIENANTILANRLLHSGDNIVAVGSITAGNEITAANSVFTPGFVNGGQLCISGDCRSSWPSSDNLGNHMAEQNLDMKRFDINNAENIRANNLLHSNRNIVAVGSITSGNEITAANSVSTPGTVRGGQLCIGSDCRNSWPSDGGSGSIGRLQVIERADPTPGVLGGGGASAQSFAACLPGETVVGGGYRGTSNLINVSSEFRATTAEGTGWLVNAHLPLGTTSFTITAIVYCATIVP